MASKLGRRSSVECVSSLAEVVEIILSFLPARALFVCMQVCRLWRDTARRIIRSRQRLGWMSFVTYHELHSTPCTSKVRENVNLKSILFLAVNRAQESRIMCFYETLIEFCLFNNILESEGL